MSTTRLSRSIPFWVLVGGSVVATAGGTYLLISKLAQMDSVLVDGTATTSDVYVGQIWAIVGGIIAGAGLVGLALSLTLGALRALVPAPAVEIVEPIAWEEEVIVTEPVADDVIAEAPDVETTSADDAAAAAAHAEPAIATEASPAPASTEAPESTEAPRA